MINKLRESLLNALESEGNDLISETTKAIQRTTDCDMCTLWSINHSPDPDRIGNHDSASLIERYLKGDERYSYQKPEDFVQDLRDSFIERVLSIVKRNNSSLLICTINDTICTKHRSYETLKRMGMSFFICIPIRDRGQDEVSAFVKLAYKEIPTYIGPDIEEITSIISKAYYSALSRFQIFQKQQILDDLIKNYSRNRSTLKEVFHPLIHRIFKSYFDYEGASVFIWDSFDNRYNLYLTTELKSYSDSECYYDYVEGLVGEVASERQAKIYDDLLFLENSGFSSYLHKYRECTEHLEKTMLAVPILRPSNPSVVLGIIRFTNKINKQSKKEGVSEIDYFNNDDVELIRNASHYLAMNVENYLAEEERKDFISKMSHEFKTPANAIRVTAQRALRKFRSNDIHFMASQFEHYMESIVDYSTLQLMQINTNLFLTKSYIKNRSNFSIGDYAIVDIIKESINIIRPIARDKMVPINNIHIEEFPNIILKVDKGAFIMVFYNLLTNAIKYHGKEFEVRIHAIDTFEGLRIYVSDYGIGIPEEDISRIFLLGVRSNNAMLVNADGYGIGLHVVKMIINAFGGNIRVSCNHNPTTFEIALPRELYA